MSTYSSVFLLADGTTMSTSSKATSTTITHTTVDSYRSRIKRLIQEDPSLAGPLIRLAFHDAATFESSRFKKTGGPNGSILYEIDRSENRAISRPLKVVQKTNIDNLTLADAIALAGAVAVEAAGGPEIFIRLGRTDVVEADPEFLKKKRQKSTERSKVEKTLPSAGLDSDGLRVYFGRLGLTEEEFVALCGCHGLGRHVSLLGMQKDCLRNLTRTCLEEAPVLLPFVTESVDRFDNSYFRYLLKWNANDIKLGDVAFIPTDVDLVVDDGLRGWVQAYADDQEIYFRVYSRAYQKLVDRTATTTERF
jgi:L-ascorbate peroxidase